MQRDQSTPKKVTERLRDALWAPIGGARSQIAWRVLGVAMCLEPTRLRIDVQIGGLLLLVLGPRIATLAIASAGALAFIIALLSYPLSAIRAPAEEFIVFATVPLFGIALARLTRDDPVAADAAQAALLRIGAASVMFFAAFAKINTDFMIESISCNSVLMGRLDAVWALPLRELGVAPSEQAIIGGELLCALLIVFLPRAGIASTLALMTPIALFGPRPFVMTVVGLSLAGLRPGDGAVLREGLRRRWPVLVALWAVAVGTVFGLFEGREIGRTLVFLLTQATVVFMIALSCANNWRGRGSTPILAGPPRARAAIVAFALLALLNGASPYLGLKQKMSFAMFSNLRTDEDRWNHLLVPRRAFLREHDPFIRLRRVALDPRGDALKRAVPRAGDRALYPALVTPQSLRFRTSFLVQRGGSADLELDYRGERLRFMHIAANPEFDRWSGALPSEVLFQRSLDLYGPQSCRH